MKKRINNLKSFRRLIITLVSAGVLYLSYSCSNSGRLYNTGEGSVKIPFGKSYDYANILVTRVVDGDTLKLENGERVRLIGIDTPEIHESEKLYRDSRKTNQDVKTIKAMGKKAAAFTGSLVENKRISLDFDVENRDKYGRLLAYVYLPDGTFVNAEIIQQGFASLMTIPPNVKHVELFKKLYQEARENKRGLWKE
ncbi:MAG: thermonuclease family protein [Candidatus Omnitrophica bacterium]|nr:thermonuclease family protein [Candidatus Omnitrophota bacterium]